MTFKDKVDNVSEYGGLPKNHLDKIRKLPVTSFATHLILKKGDIELSAQNTSNKDPCFYVDGKKTRFGTYNFGRAMWKFYTLTKREIK